MLTEILHLSSFTPVKLTYRHNVNEDLKSNYKTLDSGLSYYTHDILENCKDVAFSNRSALVLTDIRDLKSAFKNQIKTVSFDNVSGSFFLSVANTSILNGDVDVKMFNNSLYIGGQGSRAVFNVVPIDHQRVQLRINFKRVQIAKEYPYDVFLSEDPLEDSEKEREIFDIDSTGGMLMFKTKTSEGYRFLSFGEDRKIRCVGVMLNEAVLNNYHFKPTFLTNVAWQYGFDPTIKEIKYYNENEPLYNKTKLNVKLTKQLSTNLLLDFPLSKVSESEPAVNLALLRTNFTSTGTFNSQLSSNE